MWSPEVGGWTMHCFSTASEWLMALRWEVVFVKRFIELLNVIHEDKSWCFGNLRIFTFQPWPDHPESCAWVPKPNSRFSSNQAHSQQIQFRTWHQVCFPVSFPRHNIPYCLFHYREDDLDGYSSSGSLVAWAFPCDLTKHDKTTSTSLRSFSLTWNGCEYSTCCQ